MATRPIRTIAVSLLLLAAMTVAPAASHSGAGGSDRDQPGSTAPAQRIALTPGMSTVLSTDFPVTRIAITDPAVADAVVVQPREILLDGKTPGVVSLIVWGENQRRQYEVVVTARPSPLEQEFRTIFPNEPIEVARRDEAIILTGRVSSAEVMRRAAEIATASDAKAKVVNMIQVPGSSTSQQVMLQVRFAEVSRRAVSELGATLFTGSTGFREFVGRTGTQQFAAPDFSDPGSAEGKLTFSDFLNLFLFNTKHNIGAVIRALQNKGLFQSLAEPNLIAFNGQEASFLAGGEIPIPVVQGATGTVTIQFKEFGIRLNFRPTIVGDMIRLKVRPEVSSLDFTNGIVLQGFRIPALSTRRAETEVELRDGQSFAIAGLLDNLTQETIAEVPVLSKIPILGYFFKSKAAQSERTELMVLITPTLVHPLSGTEAPPLPKLMKPFLPPADSVGELLDGGGGVVDAPKNSRKPAAGGAPRQ